MTEVRLDEPVAVQARFLSNGRVRPTAFVRQGRTYRLAGLGRQWTEERDDGVWRCFLAQTTAGDTVELRWNQATHQWRLGRAWWRSAAV
ncbi:MAG: hypothetical protein NZ528_00400 [Caldilineales bacterium]|nr:hypothetical protein [Caldilineales bacterium]MDW8318814.1 hypothetical protein [Anaerolineae bacterium]